MARIEKRLELKPVDNSVVVVVPVVGLDSEETLSRPKPVRLEVPHDLPEVTPRLELRAREDHEFRTHQPGIEVLIEPEIAQIDPLEHDWGKDSSHRPMIPWGWFVLAGLLAAGAVVWSLSGVKKAETKASQLRVETQTVLGDEAQKELDAGRLIDRMEKLTRKFFETTNIDALTRLVRHPDRVRPLMERHYSGQPPIASPVLRINQMQPITVENRAAFWMTTVELVDKQVRNLIIEVLDNGEARIDWETLVCHQPMKWDTFAAERPAGQSFDFRVYLEPDNFFSHEFADSERWNSYRLTTRDSEESLFGYAAAGEESSRLLNEQLRKSQGRKCSVILRLRIPEGIQSRLGVVIEKVLSPRWLYLESPEG